jgi:competence protein ComGC
VFVALIDETIIIVEVVVVLIRSVTNLTARSLQVSGRGLALAAVVVEQDAAYWEVHVERAQEGSVEAMFGVATKKDRKFYTALEEQEEGKGKH